MIISSHFSSKEAPNGFYYIIRVGELTPNGFNYIIRVGELTPNGFWGCRVPALPSYFPTTFLNNGGGGEVLKTATCLKTVVVVSKGMLPVTYFRSNTASFLCQLTFVQIIRLSKS